jgi:response regulator RpfG family c-di-GMP phosphodiesterase
MAERQTRTVILHDRSRRERDLCRAVLERAGWRIADANTSDQIALLARVYRPDLIVIGISQPAETEVRAIEQLRDDARTAATPVLVVGQAPARQEMEAALEAGADEYLSRPFNEREFLLRMSFALNVRGSQRRARQSQVALNRRVDAMSTLQGFYQQMLGNSGVEATCRHSVEVAGELANSDRVSVLLTEPDGCSLRFAHAIGTDDFGWRDRRVSLSSPVVGRVMATRREVVVNHTTLWPMQDRYRGRQFVSLPLLPEDSPQGRPPLGVLNVTERRDGRDYEPQDILALRQLARAAAFSIDNARTRRKLDATRDSILFSLARLSEYRHASTGRHLERVRELSLLLAAELAGDPRLSENIDVQFLSDLGRAAPLHDVGKVGIPDRILLKPGQLTPEEYTLIQSHTRIGAAALESVIAAGHDASFLRMAMEIAYSHHERYDGTGYPRQLAGDRIPLSARIVCLADSYDAIRTAREYKPARSHADACRELTQAAGSQFDPLVAEAFGRLENQFEGIYNSLMEACPATDGLPEEVVVQM